MTFPFQGWHSLTSTPHGTKRKSLDVDDDFIMLRSDQAVG